MSMHHHQEFTLHAFLYIARLLAEQRDQEILQLGLRPEQTEAIRTMTAGDIHEMSLNIRGHFLEVRLDPAAFDAALAMLERRKNDEDLNMALIRAGARYEMMHHFCGMTTDEYARHRRNLDLADGRGRPQIPDEKTQALIWQCWLDSVHETDLKRRYLKVHEQTKVPVGTIWKLIDEWDETGLTPLVESAIHQDSGDSKDPSTEKKSSR